MLNDGWDGFDTVKDERQESVKTLIRRLHREHYGDREHDGLDHSLSEFMERRIREIALGTGQQEASSPREAAPGVHAAHRWWARLLGARG